MSQPKQIAVSIVRIGIPILILGWLVHGLWQKDREALLELWQSANNWPQFALSIVVYLGAVMGTFFRWYLLVIALRLPFRIRDALRLGFIGYLLQFASLGSVGGDVFKAVFIAKEQPSRRPEAVATVFIDRLVGLFGLLILASIVLALTDATRLGALNYIKPLCLALAGVGCVVFFASLSPALGLNWWITRSKRWPPIRAALIKIEEALAHYRSHRGTVFLAVGIGVVTHFMHGLAIYLAAQAFFPGGPGLFDQQIMWVISGTVAAIPISPAGLGPFDATYNHIYRLFAEQMKLVNEGFLVAILYRVMCLTVAAIGIVTFLGSRKEIAELPTVDAANDSSTNSVEHDGGD